MVVRLTLLTGKDIAPLIPDFARLCTVVFREWPHLYDGDGRYDVAHLRSILESPRAALIMAFDGNVPVGASTCLPLEDATPNVQAPFLARGWPLARSFYFAESVLLPSYRGQGTGAAFFALRENHVRAVSECDSAWFCAVRRPGATLPVDARRHDAFWRRQGYAPVPDMQCTMLWREIGKAEDSEISLSFWHKSLLSG